MPLEKPKAIIEWCGVGARAVNVPRGLEGPWSAGERTVYTSFPVLMFHISTLPSDVPTHILLRYVAGCSMLTISEFPKSSMTVYSSTTALAHKQLINTICHQESILR